VQDIKHDGYRLMARRDPVCIRLLTMNGHDWSPALSVQTVCALRLPRPAPASVWHDFEVARHAVHEIGAYGVTEGSLVRATNVELRY